MTKKIRAIELYHQGFSIRRIARLLGVSRGTVRKWILGEKSGKERKKKNTLPQELKEKLKTLLEHSVEEKGRTRTLSFRQVWKALEIELKMAGIGSYHTFLRRLKLFIQEEYGSLYQLETKRRSKKELHQYKPRGRVERRKGWMEVDATGYTYNGKLYSILLAQDEESGFVLGYMTIENKEKDARHYNKAFNELDYMYFLWHVFSHYGVPIGIKTDNERFLTARNVERACRELGVQIQRTKPYSPNQKLIERTIRDLKEKIRLISAVSQSSFDEIIEQAIELYNKEEHSFLTGKWVPAERFQGYTPIDTDILRIALSVEEERSIINGYIRFENKIYEFRQTEDTELELGRDKKAPKVKVRIDIEDNTKAYIYNWQGNFLGIARLISAVEETNTIVEKQGRQTAKRVERRKKKLREELYELEKPEMEKKKDFDLLLQIQETPQTEVKKEETFDILDILSGGET